MSSHPIAAMLAHRFRHLVIGVLLALAVFAAWRMLERPLWGWWPLVLELSAWMAIALFAYPASHTRKKWFGAATLSGILLGLGFPPSPLTFLVIVAWIPLLTIENSIYWHRERVEPRRIFLLSFHAFALWNIISTFWVINTALAAGLVANFLNAGLMAGAFTVYHLLRRRLPDRWGWLTFPVVWISFEYLHHFWDISWPWLTLGNSLAHYPWAAQWYAWTGIFGGSAWILSLNVLGCVMILRWMRARPVRTWVYPALLAVPVMISLVLWMTTRPGTATPVPVTIVQPNFEPHYEKFDIPQREQLTRFLSLSLSRVDSTTEYLVFPETSFEGVRLNDIRDHAAISLFQELVDSLPRMRLIAGISSYRVLTPGQLPPDTYRVHIDRRGDTTYWDVQNAAVQLAAGQDDIPVYFKSRLVPGPEMFPFRDLLYFLKPIIDQLGGTYEGHTTQEERTVFTGGSLAVAPVICYESVYGAYCGDYVKAGATAFAIVTNDGWWDNTPGHIQHLKIGALRAIEHRRPIIRSANTGISAFIDIRGRIHQPTRYGEAVAIRGEVIPEQRITLYTRIGDAVAWLAVAGFVICLLWAIFRSYKRCSASDASSPA